jgi:tetratricopeptide (TPR) repeat protein
MTRRARTSPAPRAHGAIALALWVGGAILAAEEPQKARKDGGSAPVAEPPPAYRGAALPLQARDTASLLARAEEHIAAGDWARGFAVLDEVLSRVTAPRGRKIARARPAETEPEDDEAEQVDVGPGGQPGLKPKDPDVEPADEVHSRDGILFVPVADHARRRLSELPPEARAVYRSTYEAPAREALNRAKSLPLARAFAELRRTAERYPLTIAGAEAWSALSERLLGAGRPAEAARALEARLEVSGDDPGQRATVLAQLAVAFLLARQPDAARRALDAVLHDHPDTMVQIRGESIRGKDLSVHPFFRALLAGVERNAAAAGAEPAWVSEGGAFDHAAYPARTEEVPSLGSRARWTYPSSGAAAGEAQAQGFAARGVSYGQTAYTRIGNEVIAIDTRSGKRLWAAPAGTPEPMRAELTGPLWWPELPVRRLLDRGTPAGVLDGRWI